MIPEFEAETGYLPPGVHCAGWSELFLRFGYTPWRRQLLAGLSEVARLLRDAGCRRLYLDGSFVTAKQQPGDYDACWDSEGVDFDVLDERLLTFDRGRMTQKRAFGGEFFIANSQADPHGTLFLEFFQFDRDGRPKGVIVLNLSELP